MLARFSLLLICLAFTTQATAEEVILFPDYKKGDSHVYEATVEINQTLSLNGMNIETAVSTMDERQLDVTKKSETSTSFELKTNRMQFNMTLPGGVTASFSSENPDREPEIPQLKPLFELLKVVSNLTASMELNNSGEIDELSINAEGLDSLPEEMKSFISDERLKDQMNQEFKRIPTDAVKKGDTWERSEVFDAGQGQYFSYTTTYKYEGQIEQDGKTYEKVTATYKDPKFDIEAGSAIPLGIKSSDLDMSKSSATFLSEPGRKGLTKSNGTMNFKGDLVFLGPGGNEIPGELDLTVTSKLNRKAK